MLSLGRERGKGIEKQPSEGAKRLENAKKMLNRGNELTILLKTQGLANFEVKNELKTNSFLTQKMANSERKYRLGANAGSGVVRNYHAFEPPVIPAKAGIQPAETNRECL
jgi:hypothetical protein